jgi:rubredoxin
VKAHNHYALCPECDREKDTLRARVAEVATVLDEHEGNPALAVMLARELLSGAAQPRGEPHACAVPLNGTCPVCGKPDAQPRGEP